MLKWVKYYLIIMKGLVLRQTVVNFFGSSYVIAGNVVTKIRSRK